MFLNMFCGLPGDREEARRASSLHAYVPPQHSPRSALCLPAHLSTAQPPPYPHAIPPSPPPLLSIDAHGLCLSTLYDSTVESLHNYDIFRWQTSTNTRGSPFYTQSTCNARIYHTRRHNNSCPLHALFMWNLHMHHR